MALHWSEIVGHQRIIRAFQRAIREDRPHPAYLFLGPPGIGKRSLARVFSRALACLSHEASPCGTCSACSKEEAGTLADLWHERPDGRQIKVAQIAELQRRLSFRRLEAKRRVVVFEEAAAMNISAQNKLLKTLEEPPNDTVLILTAVHPGQLLETVRSRCQKVHLGPVPDQEIATWLQGQGIEAEAASLAAGASRGVPAEAKLLTDPELAETRSQHLNQLLSALSGTLDERDRFVSDLGRDRTAVGTYLSLLEELSRDTALTQLQARTSPIHKDAKPQNTPLATLSPRQLAEFCDRIQEARGPLARHVDPQGVLASVLDSIPAGRP